MLFLYERGLHLFLRLPPALLVADLQTAPCTQPGSLWKMELITV